MFSLPACLPARPPVLSSLQFVFSCLQTEIAKRLNAIIAQVLPFLAQEVSLKTSISSVN
jgi:hypothetical protein